MQPIIGYTVETSDPLIEHIEWALRTPLDKAGALAIVLSRWTPLTDVDRILDLVDGVQLSGGADVHPDHYGADQHETTEPIAEHQDAFELALARGALERGMPILGICRGAQVLAVADGGELVQDVKTFIEDDLGHTNDWQGLAHEPEGPHMHEVIVEKDSSAAGWFGDGPRLVNSFHHQCVKRTGQRMRVTVTTPDGVVEATERADGCGFAAGLQWHNELLWERDERFLGPHRELVEAARAYRIARGK